MGLPLTVLALPLMASQLGGSSAGCGRGGGVPQCVLSKPGTPGCPAQGLGFRGVKRVHVTLHIVVTEERMVTLQNTKRAAEFVSKCTRVY